MRKKLNREDEYWTKLSIRLKEERVLQNLSQQQLADKSDLSREKINYTEQNITGRTLQINELARIAKALNISVDYLLGLSEDRNSNVKSNNEVAKSEIYDKILQNFNDQELMKDYQMYLVLVNIRNNILTTSVNRIKDKVKKKERIPNAEVQKFGFLLYYIDTMFQLKKIGYAPYVRFMLVNYEEKILSARKECEQILLYNENREDTKIHFKKLEEIIEILKDLEDYILYKIDKKFHISISQLSANSMNDDNFYNQAREFIKGIVLK